MEVILSRRLENSSTLSPSLCICNLSPSSLYSAATGFPIWSRMAWADFSRSASIGLIGFPTSRWIFSTPARPCSAATPMTNPRSDVTL